MCFGRVDVCPREKSVQEFRHLFGSFLQVGQFLALCRHDIRDCLVIVSCIGACQCACQQTSTCMQVQKRGPGSVTGPMAQASSTRARHSSQLLFAVATLTSRSFTSSICRACAALAFATSFRACSNLSSVSFNAIFLMPARVRKRSAGRGQWH